MTEQPADDDSGLRVGRRSVLAALGTAAATGGGLPSTVGAESTTDGPAVELGPFDLPTWEQVERHEAAETPSSDNQASNVLARRITSVRRSVSQVNLKLWEGDDAGRSTCGGAVGHQHRFVATTIVQGSQKRSLSSYYNEYDPSRPGARWAGYRNPPVEALAATDEMESRVRIPDGAPNEDACGTTTFRVNNVYRKRLPLTAVSDGQSLYGDSSPERIRDAVSTFQQRRTTRSAYVPDDDAGLVGLATTVLGAVGDPDLGSAVGASELFLDAVSGLHPYLERAKGVTGKFGTVGAWAGVGGDSLKLLQAIDELDDYNGKLAWGDDDVYVATNKGTAHPFEIQFVDFTVTVPPGEQSSEGTTVEITQNVGVDDANLDTASYFDGHRPEDGGYLKTDHTWELEIPAYTADDFGGVDESRLPTLRSVVDGERTAFGTTRPDPSIEISRSGTTEADPITFAVADYEDDGDSTYRWRVYKNGGVVRPATLFGREASLEAGVLDRSPDPTVSAFGPGQYVAELTVRDRFGQTTTVTRNFVVDPAETVGTTATVPETLVTVERGETVELSASESVGHDGTADSIDLIEWDVQYPTAVTGGVVDADAGTVERRRAGVDPPAIKPPKTEPTRATVEHTFEHVGIYRAAVRVWSLEGSYSPSTTKQRYYSKGLAAGDRTPYADKRDVTVVVAPETGSGGGAEFDPATGPGPIPVGRGGGRR